MEAAMATLLSISNHFNPVLLTPTASYHGLSLHHHHLRRRSFPQAASSRLLNSTSNFHGRSMLQQCSKAKATSEKQPQPQPQQEEDEDEDLELVAKTKTVYNDIMIVDSPHSRMLILDSTYNVHSILFKDKKWTDSYWDEFATLPPIIPTGPIAILGLGGGTAAHLMLDLWPELQLEGWEIDQILIDRAREHFGLSDLEKPTEAGGILNVRIGDALSPAVNIPGGYAGIIVDLFANGVVLPQLQEVATWLEFKNWLMPNGRIMVNCGGTVEAAEVDLKNTSSNTLLIRNSTIKALSKAFPGELSWKRKPKENGANQMALTGPIPDSDSWSEMIPGPLSAIVKDWMPFKDS